MNPRLEIIRTHLQSAKASQPQHGPPGQWSTWPLQHQAGAEIFSSFLSVIIKWTHFSHLSQHLVEKVLFDPSPNSEFEGKHFQKGQWGVRCLPLRVEEMRLNILLFRVSEWIYIPLRWSERVWHLPRVSPSRWEVGGGIGGGVCTVFWLMSPHETFIISADADASEDADIYAATLASQLGEPTWNCAFTMNNSGYILLATRTCDGPSAKRLRATSAVTLTGICRLFSQCGEENVPFAQLFPQLMARHLKGNEL